MIMLCELEWALRWRISSLQPLYFPLDQTGRDTWLMLLHCLVMSCSVVRNNGCASRTCHRARDAWSAQHRLRLPVARYTCELTKAALGGQPHTFSSPEEDYVVPSSGTLLTASTTMCGVPHVASDLWMKVIECTLAFNMPQGPWSKASFFRKACQCADDFFITQNEHHPHFLHFFEQMALDLDPVTALPWGSDEHLRHVWDLAKVHNTFFRRFEDQALSLDVLLGSS